MPDNRRAQKNGGLSDSTSNPSPHNIEEPLRRLKIQTNEEEDGIAVARSMAYPDRPGEPDCLFYLRTGFCGYGNNCRFNHPTCTEQANKHDGALPERVGEPDCAYFLKTGICKYGSTCKYNHPRDGRDAAPVELNTVGLPMRKEEKPCPHYMRTGSCKFGVKCKFHHPQPAPNASSMVPSSGSSPLPWPITRATYVSNPLLQSPLTYLPMLLPPSRTIGPTQGWNSYMGSASPVSSSSIYGGWGSVEEVYPLTSSSFPERPGEPECRYFMNTGNCKYGSDCKYHHPKDTSLGPFGLPLRPGQTICSYYSLYGICKYGPTCKYDHPLVGYTYNYSTGVSILDPSLFLNGGRNLPTVPPPEISPSKLSKTPAWTGKPMSDGDLHSNVKTHEGSDEHGGSRAHSFSDASEHSHDQSD